MGNHLLRLRDFPHVVFNCISCWHRFSRTSWRGCHSKESWFSISMPQILNIIARKRDRSGEGYVWLGWRYG